MCGHNFARGWVAGCLVRHPLTWEKIFGASQVLSGFEVAGALALAAFARVGRFGPCSSSRLPWTGSKRISHLVMGPREHQKARPFQTRSCEKTLQNNFNPLLKTKRTWVWRVADSFFFVDERSRLIYHIQVRKHRVTALACPGARPSLFLEGSEFCARGLHLLMKDQFLYAPIGRFRGVHFVFRRAC
jgi:hypothetical protein